MSSSDFSCSCGYKIGTVKSGVLKHERGVKVKTYLRSGYAVLTCPSCGKMRTFRGNRVEAK